MIEIIYPCGWFQHINFPTWCNIDFIWMFPSQPIDHSVDCWYFYFARSLHKGSQFYEFNNANRLHLSWIIHSHDWCKFTLSTMPICVLKNLLLFWTHMRVVKPRIKGAFLYIQDKKTLCKFKSWDLSDLTSIEIPLQRCKQCLTNPIRVPSPCWFLIEYV